MEFALAWTPHGGPPADLSFLEFSTTTVGVEPQLRAATVAHHADRTAQLTRADRTFIVSAVSVLAGGR